jgi:acyl-CoA reductase-like NAD-dependent aldehyde dehydrogenase
MSPNYKLWINGKSTPSTSVGYINSPFSGEMIAQVSHATKSQMQEAIAASVAAFKTFRTVSRFCRARLLAAMAEGIVARRQQFVNLLINEGGKPVIMAEAEVNRALNTFTLAAEEAKRFGGEIIPLDIDSIGRAYAPAQSYWVPRGPVLAITPFNFPLNLVAHKLAPALAVGTTVLLKPPPQAPGCSYLLAEVFEEAAKAVSDSRESIPLAAFQVVSAPNEVVSLAVDDPRMSILSFTGSDKVGWLLQEKAIKKKVILELGGNAGVIVHSDADLGRAANRCAFGGFAYAGQTCISVQRIFVQEDVMDEFLEKLLKETSAIKYGNPQQKDILVGPVINDDASARIMDWIEAAKKEGARVLIGGERQGRVIAPTVLTGVQENQKLSCEEVFGPVVIVNSYKVIEEAIEAVNDSRFGLQAGIFTDSSKIVTQALQKLEVGGILVNEVPTYRADNMPYGGVKESGLGREGVKYAMEDYCERRTLVTWIG